MLANKELSYVYNHTSTWNDYKYAEHEQSPFDDIVLNLHDLS